MGLTTFVSFGQTIWDGETITFTKTGGADWTLEANQDRITDNVWITRANNQGLFNIADETDYEDFVSPTDTEWAYGNTSNLSSLTFDTWENTNGSNPPSMVDQEMVLHLISDDIYIDIMFTQWGQGSGGQGSFSYERSSESLSTESYSANTISIYPNPAENYFMIENLESSLPYKIYDISGKLIQTGIANQNQPILIDQITSGIYFIKLKNSITKKLIKS